MSEVFSILLSQALDSLGYGSQQRQFRRDGYKEIDKKHVRNGGGYDFITVGSKGEGITNVFERDRDTLIIDRHSICVEEGHPIGHIPSDMNVFRFNSWMSGPGHTVLILGRPAFSHGMDALLCKSLVDIGHGWPVLSSSEFVKHVEDHVRATTKGDDCVQVLGGVGPATKITRGKFDEDYVHALQCLCPSILQQWAIRPRCYDWPQPDLIREVTEMEAFVVATGDNNGKYKCLEWRVCFNTGETKLLVSLNDAQIKLYILLKMTLHDIIKAKDKEITTYVMKNMVFWLAEMNPQYMFRTENLCTWYMKALKMLQRSINLGFLPYYMIPGRNLLAGRMDVYQNQALLRRVRCIYRAGPIVLLGCRRLRFALTALNPEQLYRLGSLRNELEMLYLFVNFISDRRSVGFSCPVGYSCFEGFEPMVLPSFPVDDDVETLMWSRIRSIIVLPGGWERLAFDGVDASDLVHRIIERILS